MSEEVLTFTAEQITGALLIYFAAPLIISSLAFILYGTNCYQLFTYFQDAGKKDPHLTKIWVGIVMLVNSSGVFYQVYFNWAYSILTFTTSNTPLKSMINGHVVVLYSVVVMLVQFFWVVVLDALMDHRLKMLIIGSITVGILCSFSMAVVVGVLSTTMPGPAGGWPTPTISIYLRVLLGLDLGIDIIILIAVLIELNRMRKAFGHLKKTFSKLSYIFLSVTTFSTIIIIGEVVVNAPEPNKGEGWIPFVITFAPLVAPTYAGAMFSILNARGAIQVSKYDEDELQEQIDGENQRPQMNFTNEVYSRAADRDSRQLPLRNHAATEPAIDIEREGGSRRSSMEEFVEQRRYSNDGNADQIQSTQFGIQTI